MGKIWKNKHKLTLKKTLSSLLKALLLLHQLIDKPVQYLNGYQLGLNNWFCK